MSKRTPEGDLVHACLEWLRLRGVFAWRNNTGAFAGEHKGRKRFIRFGAPGSPDIIGVLPGGRFLGVECKAGRGKQTLDQHDFQISVEARGGLYLLVRSLDDLEKNLPA